MQPQHVAVTTPFCRHADVLESQIRRLRRHRCFFRNLSAIFSPGYPQVACNSLMGGAGSVDLVLTYENSRRLECRIASKQYWPLACLQLWLHVRSKKKSYTSKIQWLWNNLRLNTKILLERAFRPVPNTLQTIKPRCREIFSRIRSVSPHNSRFANSLFYTILYRKRSGIRYLVVMSKYGYVVNSSTLYSYFAVCLNNSRRLTWQYIRKLCAPLALQPFLAHVRRPNQPPSRPNRSSTSLVTQPDVAVAMEPSQTFRVHMAGQSKGNETPANHVNVWAVTTPQHKFLARRHTANLMAQMTMNLNIPGHLANLPTRLKKGFECPCLSTLTRLNAATFPKVAA